MNVNTPPKNAPNKNAIKAGMVFLLFDTEYIRELREHVSVLPVERRLAYIEIVLALFPLHIP